MFDMAGFVPLPATPYLVPFRSLKFHPRVASPLVPALSEALKSTRGHPIWYNMYCPSSRSHGSNDTLASNHLPDCGPLQASSSGNDPRTQDTPHLISHPCSLPQGNAICSHVSVWPTQMHGLLSTILRQQPPVPVKDNTPQGEPEMEAKRVALRISQSSFRRSSSFLLSSPTNPSPSSAIQPTFLFPTIDVSTSDFFCPNLAMVA